MIRKNLLLSLSILLCSSCYGMQMNVEDLQNLAQSDNVCETVRAFLDSGQDPNQTIRIVAPNAPPVPMSLLELALSAGRIDLLRILLADPRTDAKVKPITFIAIPKADLLSWAASECIFTDWRQWQIPEEGCSHTQRQESIVLEFLRAGIDHHQAIGFIEIFQSRERIKQLLEDWDACKAYMRLQALTFFQAGHSRLGASSAAQKCHSYLFDYIGHYVVCPDEDDTIDTIHEKAEAYRAMMRQ